MAMINKFKLIFIGFCIGLLIAGFFIAQYWPRAGEPVKVIENPAGNQPAIKIESQGKLFGSISISNQGQNQPNNPYKGKSITGQNDPLKTPVLTLFDNDKLTVPVSGEIKTEYYNSGKQIGTGTHRIDGETILTASANELQAETIFNNSYRISVEVPDPPPKANWIGVYTILIPERSLGGYYQRNFQLIGNTGGLIRVEIGKEIRIVAGMEYQF